MSGTSPQCTSRTDSCGVRVDDADVGAEGDLQSTAEGVAMDGGDHRDGQLLPHPGDLLAEVGEPRSAGSCPAPFGRRRSSCSNIARSSPAQNDLPSPDSTTARTAVAGT